METTRRRSLRALGAVVVGASVAGCLADDDPGVGDSPSGDGDDGTGSDPDQGGVTVEAVHVRPELVTRNSPDSYGTYGARNEQYVVVELAVETPADHPPESFAVEAGGETHEVITALGQGYGFLAEFDMAYGAEDGTGSGWLAASLPKPLEAETKSLTWDGGSHAFDDAVLERLRRPPATFDVGFDAPESTTVGETVTATVTVENVGDVDGTFVGALTRVGPLVAYAPEAAIVLDVESGGTASWEFTHDIEERVADREAPEMELHLRWDDERTSRTIDVERA